MDEFEDFRIGLDFVQTITIIQRYHPGDTHPTLGFIHVPRNNFLGVLAVKTEITSIQRPPHGIPQKRIKNQEIWWEF